MAAMTTKQKDATRKFMLQEIARLTELESKMFVMRAVTHLPWQIEIMLAEFYQIWQRKGNCFVKKEEFDGR